MTLKIANAPCSWGVDYAEDKNNPDWKKVMTGISDSGYSYSELGPFGYLPKDYKIIIEHLEKINLTIIGGFIFDNIHEPSQHLIIRKKVIKNCKLLKNLNASFFVIIDHISPERMMTSGNQKNSIILKRDKYYKMISFIKEIAKICFEDFGLMPVLHPHAGSYIEYESEIDNILDLINDNYLGLCLDTAHLYYSSVDPYLAIKKYSSKIKHMHFKDIDNRILQTVYKDRIDFDSAVKMNVFCPLGSGIINFKKILDNLKSIKYNGFATIEQDIDPSEGLHPEEYARNSLKFLKNYLNRL